MGQIQNYIKTQLGKLTTFILSSPPCPSFPPTYMGPITLFLQFDTLYLGVPWWFHGLKITSCYFCGLGTFWSNFLSPFKRKRTIYIYCSVLCFLPPQQYSLRIHFCPYISSPFFFVTTYFTQQSYTFTAIQSQNKQFWSYYPTSGPFSLCSHPSGPRRHFTF